MKNRILTVSIIHYKADFNMLNQCISSIKKSASRYLKQIQIDIIHGKNGKEIDWSLLLRSYNDMFVRVFNNEKSAVNFQNQLAIDVCETDYWTVVDDDDELEPGAINAFFDEFQNDNENIDCYQMIISRYCNAIEEKSWMATMIMNHAKIYKIKTIRDNNIYFHEDLVTNEDAWFGTLFMSSNPNIKNLNIKFYRWNEMENSITDKWKKNLKSWQEINLLTMRLIADEYKKRKPKWKSYKFYKALYILANTAFTSGCTKEQVDKIYKEIQE